jgi:hypothetical protein
MTVTGAYLLLQQVVVTGGYWHFDWLGGSGRSFGLTLIPLLIGIGILFYNGRSQAGRCLTGFGALVIVVGILANIDIQIREIPSVRWPLMLRVTTSWTWAARARSLNVRRSARGVTCFVRPSSPATSANGFFGLSAESPRPLHGCVPARRAATSGLSARSPPGTPGRWGRKAVDADEMLRAEIATGKESAAPP